MKFILIIVSLASFIALFTCVVINSKFDQCEQLPGLNCTIDKLTLEGCRIDRVSGICKVKRNKTAAMNMMFTPDFDGSNVTMVAYAQVINVEKQFPGMDTNACNFMSCPVVKNATNFYKFNLTLSSWYPKGMFRVRWLMSQAGKPKCCFTTKVRIE